MIATLARSLGSCRRVTAAPTPLPDACTCARCGGNPANTTTHREDAA